MCISPHICFGVGDTGPLQTLYWTPTVPAAALTLWEAGARKACNIFPCSEPKTIQKGSRCLPQLSEDTARVAGHL